MAVTSLAIFLTAFAWMAWRVRVGADPVLSKVAAKQAPAPAKHIKRVVVVRKVIVTELPPAQSTAAPAAYAAPATGGQQSYSPPASAAPAPSPAPAPMPVTRGS